ncbi:unnamed protein product [Ceutorhynchus assimilis]|uniref:Ribosomal protein mS38 C-terminal domain-containing protein n=1 Tax=Ceutorhynchus assimilis TaxID=467358 RepID=A0A9N9MST4_9CUCU|nr:unnamed protein product [Ceutorhynchus assimilis]
MSLYHFLTKSSCLCEKMFLFRIFNANSIKALNPIIRKCLSTQQQIPRLPRIHFIPALNSWIYNQNDKIISPKNSSNKIELPNGLTWVPPLIDPIKISTEIIVPSTQTADTPREAIRMIVIRRKKMKRHKLRKLKKKMKYEWAKLKQNRELKKEKAFQRVLIQQCKDAESFCADDYVEKKLDKLHEVVIPRYWKGKRYPEFLIRQKMGLPAN